MNNVKLTARYSGQGDCSARCFSFYLAGMCFQMVFYICLPRGNKLFCNDIGHITVFTVNHDKDTCFFRSLHNLEKSGIINHEKAFILLKNL